ncbi:hypothetical protein ACMD2_16675 [Ananas comosus]|uniref:FLZ-type domain-containing protein n=1 Tax=Ananas comosus TaxID=4615 RepID=A0A199VFG0_ANACO|nr:hypothetical protein ACMD2_16675 [Ananas comosus]
MAGLSVVLEAHEPFPKNPQIISKPTMIRNSSLSSPSSSHHPYSHYAPTTPFLEHCFLCNKKLSHGQDIYMYRGDRAFCSVECRCRQIYMDEESVRREKKCSAFAATDTTTVAAASRRRGRVGGKGGALDGGFAF